MIFFLEIPILKILICFLCILKVMIRIRPFFPPTLQILNKVVKL
jgi:hypothetical protein